MSSPVEEHEGEAPRTARDAGPRVVVVSLVVLIVVGLALAIVLVVKNRSTGSKQPASQSSVSTTDTTPRAQSSSTSSTPTPESTASAGAALDPARVAAAIDPWLVQLTIKRPGGATDTGNGIVLTSDGQFLANDHLVDGAVSIMGTVGAPGNTHTYTATVIGHDSPRDTGLLQLQGASGLQTPAFGVSATVAPGQPVTAVGHAPAPGAAPAMIPGIVLGVNQRVPATDPDSELKSLGGVIQIYALVQPEDNGGPLVNSAGQIIGVLVAEAASLQTQSAVPVAYAIPIKTALDSAQQIREGNLPG